MSQLRISCLGAFQASLDGEPLTFDTDKTRALLVYLALEGWQPQRRGHLAGLLWSDMPEKRAMHSLRQALSGLRKTLDEDASAPHLLIQRETVQINPANPIWVDVTAFEQHLGAALRHYQPFASGVQPANRLDLRQLQRAVSLFRGSFLDQLYLSGSPLFDEWASLKRERLDRQMIEALTILADLHEQRGELTLARQFAEQIVTLAPWDETAQAQLMRLLGLEGHWSAAQAQYHHLRRYLQEQVGVEPAQETVTLSENIRRAAAQNNPRLLTPLRPPARHNLPLTQAVFIGREHEQDQISAALADPYCRLLTLTGPGGVGKTRLALEAARQQIAIFRDGVYFIPLAALPTVAQLPEALAETLGFASSDEAIGPEKLRYFIGAKQMLLLLDNLEHFLPLAAENPISAILAEAPGVVILATSRQRLNLAEEHLIPLEGLPYPKDPLAPAVGESAALRLFTSRAQRILPNFDLSIPANHQAVARICQTLEGLPLGIELAAAALWLHTPVEIAAQLSNSLHPLASNAINAQGRHRSLWAAFDVSWRLLSADEKSLLAVLSVFRGGFEPEMVQQVIEAPPIRLAALLDKSLLRRDSTGRYDMHEAIRQFAAEKLAANAELSVGAHAAHAQSFARFLAARVSILKSAGQAQALAEIAQEWENVRQAWAWLVRQQNEAEVARCAEAIFHFCNIRTRYREGMSLFAQSRCCLPENSLAFARSLTFEGALAFRALETEVAASLLERALAAYKTLDSADDLALCLVFASGAAARCKQNETARQQCQQAIDLFERRGNHWGLAYAWYQWGLLQSRAGNPLEAQNAFESSLQSARVAGDQRRQVGPLNTLGDLACQLGAYRKAEAYFEESLEISRALDDRYNIAQANLNLGTIFHADGQYGQAKHHYEESLAISREIGDLVGQSLVFSNLGELALAQGLLAEGVACFEQSLALASKIGDEWAITISQINLGDAALRQNNTEAACQYLVQALAAALQMKDPSLVLRVLLHLGQLHLQNGALERGLSLLQLVLHHPAAYAEHRDAARQALGAAGLPTSAPGSLALEAAAQAELAKMGVGG